MLRLDGRGRVEARKATPGAIWLVLELLVVLAVLLLQCVGLGVEDGVDAERTAMSAGRSGRCHGELAKRRQGHGRVGRKLSWAPVGRLHGWI